MPTVCEGLTQPKDPQVRIWKYMDFTKFVSLLDSGALYFTRADKFNDPFEGSWPKINAKKHKSYKGYMIEILRRLPRYHAVNCWHMNEHESAAMWKLYLKSDEGIAVQSTYSRLSESFVDNEQVWLGMVQYIDYEVDEIDEAGLHCQFMYKRKSFEHEREVRAVIGKWPETEEGLDFDLETISHGLKIGVDIAKLIERVFVAPSVPDWYADLVSGVIKKYGYEFQVSHSMLSDLPVF